MSIYMNMNARTTAVFEDFTSKLDTLNSLIKTGADKKEDHDAVNKAKNELNKALKRQRADELNELYLTVSPVSFWTEYLYDTSAPAVSIVTNKDTDLKEYEMSEQRVPYSYVCQKSTKVIPTQANYAKYIGLLIHNISRNSIASKENEGASNGSLTALPVSLQSTLKDAAPIWQECSNRAMLKQLNIIVGMIYPDGLAPDYEMWSADLRALKTAVEKYKSEAKSNGRKIDVNSIASAEKAIIDAIHDKIAGIGVTITNREFERMNKKESPAPADNSPAAPMNPVKDTEPAPAPAEKPAEKTGKGKGKKPAADSTAA